MIESKVTPDLELPPDEVPPSGGGLKSTNTAWTTRDWSGGVAGCPVDVAHEGNAPPAMPLPAERFEVRSVLGSGGFGEVSLAWDKVLLREVAIKRPLTRLNSQQQQAFLDEARLAARIRHPGIIVVHDVDVDDLGRPIIVYEYHPGGSLKDRLTGNPWPVAKALELAIAVAEALAEAHRHGLTHRDLKPANILLDRHGRPQIADFGLAVDEGRQWGLSGEVAGTDRYMAPEQFRGEADRLDGRTDLWALGVILYELLTGHRPFEGGGYDEVREQVLGRDPRPPRQWVDSIPPRVEQLCLQLLAKPVAERVGSASAAVEELRACLAEVAPPAQSAPAGNRLAPRGLVVAAGVSVVAVLSIVGIAWLLRGDGRPPSDPRPPTTPAAATVIPGTQSSPAAMGEYPSGVWIPLLEREPAAVFLSPQAERTFASGQLRLRSEFPAMLQLGATRAANYSLRISYQPNAWNGDVGLFCGLGPVPHSDESDHALLVGISERPSGKVTVSARTMTMQRHGRQFPQMFFQFPECTREVPPPGDGITKLQVDVKQRRLSQIFVNNVPLELPPSAIQAEFDATGRFGLYLLGGWSNFLNADIRVTLAE
jgi:hypothetical protein